MADTTGSRYVTKSGINSSETDTLQRVDIPKSIPEYHLPMAFNDSLPLSSPEQDVNDSSCSSRTPPEHLANETDQAPPILALPQVVPHPQQQAQPEVQQLVFVLFRDIGVPDFENELPWEELRDWTVPEFLNGFQLDTRLFIDLLTTLHLNGDGRNQLCSPSAKIMLRVPGGNITGSSALSSRWRRHRYRTKSPFRSG